MGTFWNWLSKSVMWTLSMIGMVGVPDDIKTLGDVYSLYIAPNINTQTVQWLSALLLALLLADLIRKFEKRKEDSNFIRNNSNITTKENDSKQKQEIEYGKKVASINITIEQTKSFCSKAKLPKKKPKCVIELDGRSLFCTRGAESLISEPGSKHIQEVTLTNLSDNHIFNLFIPIQVDYKEAIKEKSSTASGEIIRSDKINLPLRKLVLKPASNSTFWLVNRSEHFLEINMLNYFIAQIDNSGVNVRVPNIQIDEDPVMLTPMTNNENK